MTQKWRTRVIYHDKRDDGSNWNQSQYSWILKAVDLTEHALAFNTYTTDKTHRNRWDISIFQHKQINIGTPFDITGKFVPHVNTLMDNIIDSVFAVAGWDHVTFELSRNGLYEAKAFQ